MAAVQHLDRPAAVLHYYRLQRGRERERERAGEGERARGREREREREGDGEVDRITNGNCSCEPPLICSARPWRPSMGPRIGGHGRRNGKLST